MTDTDTQKMRQFRRAIRSCGGKPLLFYMRDGYGAVLGGLLERVGRGLRVHDSEIRDMMANGHGRQASRFSVPQRIRNTDGKVTAVVSVRGVAMYDLEYQPQAFSTLLLAQTVTALSNDPEVGTIVLDIDSPGGMVTGTAEAGDAIFAARKRKKVVALVNPLCASAAYWIASQASEIIAIKSADIGSIGVFMTHMDCSKFDEMNGLKITYIYAGEHKVEGNPHEPLADEARTYHQSQVDKIYAGFVTAVARGRGVSAGRVKDAFGKGRCLMAPDAVAVGMIDRLVAIENAFAPGNGGSSFSAIDDRRRRLDAFRHEKSPAAARQRLLQLERLR
jgi:signal peptide peptidase SppA